ncbi:MAG: hypothetical protein US19_C0013G0021, partial [Candidatus Daviesbacteria bacterium GW2011_GWB1_36_5]
EAGRLEILQPWLKAIVTIPEMPWHKEILQEKLFRLNCE